MTDLKPTVLIVEDDPLILASLASQFESDGFAVTTALNGEEGLAAFAAARPAALVMDVSMPKKDGIDMLEDIAKSFPGHGVPVFVLTNNDDMNNVANALRNDVVAYIMKSDKTLSTIAQMVKAKLNP